MGSLSHAFYSYHNNNNNNSSVISRHFANLFNTSSDDAIKWGQQIHLIPSTPSLSSSSSDSKSVNVDDNDDAKKMDTLFDAYGMVWLYL
jgi:hypothetical protein